MKRRDEEMREAAVATSRRTETKRRRDDVKRRGEEEGRDGDITDSMECNFLLLMC
jgi:hypothetical protein